MKPSQIKALKQVEQNLGIKIEEHDGLISQYSSYELNKEGDIDTLYLGYFEFLDIVDLLPLESYIKYLSLEEGVVVNFDKITQFTKLTNLKLQKVNIIESPIKTLYEKPCFLKKIEIRYYKGEIIFDIRQLLPIAPYIECLVIGESIVEGQEALKYFPNLKEFELVRTNEINIEYLLPIAPQIEKLIFEDTKVKHIDKLSHFTNLKVLDLELLDDTLTSFKPLASLSKNLEKLRITQYTGVIKDFHLIKPFVVLKELVCHLESITPKGLAAICSLGKLKSLDLTVYECNKNSVDISELKALESLEIGLDKAKRIKGFEHLSQLRKLKLESEFKEIKGLEGAKKLTYLEARDLNIDKIPVIKSLKILNLEVAKDVHIQGLEQFPNLEQLKIETTENFRLGELKHLKTLILISVDEEVKGINKLENLEELNLNDCRLKTIDGIKSLKKLKRLDIAENKLTRIKVLEDLKNLEAIDLGTNVLSEIETIEILKQLPNLKEVDLGWDWSDKEMAKRELEHLDNIFFKGHPRKSIFIDIPYWNHY